MSRSQWDGECGCNHTILTGEVSQEHARDGSDTKVGQCLLVQAREPAAPEALLPGLSLHALGMGWDITVST